jgi:hypothetical protein
LDTYAIDLSLGSTLNGGFIDGFQGQPNVTGSVCHGIKAAGSTVNGMRVRRLNNKNGIVSTSSDDVITNNHVGELGTWTAFIWAQGAVAVGNKGYTTSATAMGDPVGTVTLDGESGLLTSPIFSAGSSGQSIYTFSLTNSLVSAASRVIATGGWGTTGQGEPVVTATLASAGHTYIRIKNLGSAYNGSITCSFRIVN